MASRMNKSWNMKIFELHNEEKDKEENETQIYAFKSYADNNGTTLWGQGTVQTTGIVEDGYSEVEVVTNEPESSFIGQKFYVTSNANPDGTTLYQLYSDAGVTSAGIYVTITEPKEADPGK